MRAGGVRVSPTCGGRCRSETGAPLSDALRASLDYVAALPGWSGTPARREEMVTSPFGAGREGGGSARFAHLRWAMPVGDRRSVPAAFKREKKQMAANRRFAAGDFGGKCERGLPPFTINLNRSELAAARRERRARELRSPARSAGRSVRGAHPQPPSNRTTNPSRAPLTDRSTWCRGAELNRRHKDFQSSALPSELPRLRPPVPRTGAVVWHSPSNLWTESRGVRRAMHPV